MEQALQQSQQRISAMKSKFKDVVQYLAADGATTPERLFSTLHQFLKVQHITNTYKQSHTQTSKHGRKQMKENLCWMCCFCVISTVIVFCFGCLLLSLNCNCSMLPCCCCCCCRCCCYCCCCCEGVGEGARGVGREGEAESGCCKARSGEAKASATAKAKTRTTTTTTTTREAAKE